MPIEQYHAPLDGKKRKRSDGRPRSVPAGGIEGFMTAKALTKISKESTSKAKATPKRVKPTLDMNAVSDSGNSGESDMDLDAALTAQVRSSGSKEGKSDHDSDAPPKKKRRQKGSTQSSTASKPKPKARVTEAIGAFSQFVSTKKLTKLEDRGSDNISGCSQRRTESSQLPHSDSDIEIISTRRTPNCSLSCSVTPSPPNTPLQLVAQKSADRPLSPLRFPFHTAFSSSREPSPRIQSEPSMEWEDGPPSPIHPGKHWLLDSDSDDEQQLVPVELSPPHSSGTSNYFGTGSLSTHSTLPPTVSSPTQGLGSFMNRIVADMRPPPSATIRKRPQLIDISTVDDIDSDASQPVRQMGARPSARGSIQPSTSPERLDHGSSLDLSYHQVHQKRALVRGRKRSSSPIPSQHQDPTLESGDSPARTSRRRKTETCRSSRKKAQQPLWDHRNDLIEMEASHSGDEISEGHSGSDGQHEDEYDRKFIADESHLTQMDSSYDQSAIYRQGLFTQAPRAELAFRGRPVRKGAFGPSDRRLNERWNSGFRVDSSPSASMNRSDDRYSIGSFVVDDEEPVSNLSDA